MKKIRVLSMIAVAFTFLGCTHHLEIHNLHEYQASYTSRLPKDLKIGITTSTTYENGKALVQGMANSLTKQNATIIYPYAHSYERDVDIIANVKINTNHEGSGNNFIVTWPGFLIWAPAWNGFKYYPTYMVNIEIVKSSDSSEIDRLNIPIRLDVNHADIGRTWVEVSWLEVSAIAFVSGFVFTNYDDSVTPLVEREIEGPVGDYLAQKVVESILKSGIAEKIKQEKSAPQVEAPKT